MPRKNIIIEKIANKNNVLCFRGSSSNVLNRYIECAKFYKVKIVRDTIDGIWLSGLPDTVEVIVVGQEYVIDGRKVIKKYQE